MRTKELVFFDELYGNKIKVTAIIEHPKSITEELYYSINSQQGLPGDLLEFICDRLSENNRLGEFVALPEWWEKDTYLYYTGSWCIIDYSLHETIADMSHGYVQQIMDKEFIEDSRAVISMIIGWAKEFDEKYWKCNWDDIDYYETIDEFINKKIKDL